MNIIGLHNALSLIAGGPDESILSNHGREIADQNQLRRLVELLARKLAETSGGKKLLDELTPEYVRRRGNERPPTPRHWPPAAVLLWLSKLDGRHAMEVENIRALASDVNAKWNSHITRVEDAERRLLIAARDGAVILFYRDHGLPTWIAIPTSVFQDIVTFCRAHGRVQVWEAPVGPAHSTLSRSSPRAIYSNVHVNRPVIDSLIASRATDSVSSTSFRSIKPAASKLGTEEHIAWLLDFERIHKNEKAKTLESIRVCAFRDKFGNFPDLRIFLRKLMKQLDLQRKRGRPKKRL